VDTEASWPCESPRQATFAVAGVCSQAGKAIAYLSRLICHINPRSVRAAPWRGGSFPIPDHQSYLGAPVWAPGRHRWNGLASYVLARPGSGGFQNCHKRLRTLARHA